MLLATRRAFEKAPEPSWAHWAFGMDSTATVELVTLSFGKMLLAHAQFPMEAVRKYSRCSLQIEAAAGCHENAIAVVLVVVAAVVVLVMVVLGAAGMAASEVCHWQASLQQISWS